jgi:hypothetical protein
MRNNIERKFEKYFDKISKNYIIQENDDVVEFNYTSSKSTLDIKQKLKIFNIVVEKIKSKYFDIELANTIIEKLNTKKSELFGIDTKNKLNEWFVNELNIYGIDDKLIETNSFNIQIFNNIGYLKLANLDNIELSIKLLEKCDYILFDLRNHTNANLEDIANLLNMVGYNNDIGIMENNNLYKLNVDNIKKNNI